MKFGDFGLLASNYAKTRPGYSEKVISEIIGTKNPRQMTALDVGAGTGIFTRQLWEAGLRDLVAAEPNEYMKSEGERNPNNHGIVWYRLSAENLIFKDSHFDLVTMASSFHWVDFPRAISEFRRVSKAQGDFVAIWNPRKIESGSIEEEVQFLIDESIPGYQRKSSGYSIFCNQLTNSLNETGFFTSVNYLEGDKKRKLSPPEYVQLWSSVNDIQVRMGKRKFQDFLYQIERRTATLPFIELTNTTRAWVARFKDKK